MRKYEIMIILDKDCDNTKSTLDKVINVLKTNGGKVVESADWGLKKFSYPINKKIEGYYSVHIVETNSDNILEFKRICKIDKYVVRTLVINTESEKRYIQSTKLSKTDMTQFKEEKRERPNRNPRYKRPETAISEAKTASESNVINSADEVKTTKTPPSEEKN